MAHVFRSQFNQHEAFVEPLVVWPIKNGVNFERGAFVSDLDFTNTSGRMSVNRLHVERANGPPTVTVAPDGIVLVTTGTQAADLRAGTMDEAPPPKPPHPGRSWALWKILAAKHKVFGDPSVFFGDDKILDSRWVTFTVTTKRQEFLDEIIKLTGSGTGSGGLLTLRDSPWVISLSIFEQPEILDQPPGLVGLWAPSGEQRHP
jgi:oleate hydratase